MKRFTQESKFNGKEIQNEEGMQADWAGAFRETDRVLRKELSKYDGLTPLAIAKHRYHKFRRIDENKIMTRNV